MTTFSRPPQHSPLAEIPVRPKLDLSDKSRQRSVKFPSALHLATILGLIAATPPAGRAADFWQERPLRIIQLVEAQFPHDLLASGVSEGQVHALLMVGADGKLLDCFITAYTHPELARELLSAVRGWEFEPARERGEPVGQRVQIMFTFRSSGAILSMTPASMVAASVNRMFKAPLLQLVCKSSELDRKPALLESVSPRHPGKRLTPPQPKGSAQIDFYIDAEGRPRMPVMLRASHEAFAIAAADAILHWRFEPPTSNGRPVAVRMVQEFIF
ncbi:MAG: energy transducer TonB [Opitutus sp.]|nr:energy transducer TonB [Opitutus sp.]